MRTPIACLAIVIAVFAWSAIAPYERSTWWMEVAPALIALPLLFATYKKFPLTTLLYVLIAVHMVILMVGGHYTYARVPGFEWLGEGRNNYDKIGHFAQGFIPAMIMRELLIRTSDLKPGKWMAVVIVFSCLGISAVYELIEWGAAVMLGQGADEFLGTQGDVWDTQKDMGMAGIGACAALLLLSRPHDKALSRL
ncbi:DUF2238 domain-containing protein [Corallococcus exiguus]|uniref:DUF2238 domain-containing protein n=1 Tax=Corallococcus exiguus TaxID=83462 RepID=A0A7X5BXP8_9BACT|nr:DUF2238 domain-containing protein [Corallococcus exiguus]NBC45373.1 DUF2238 domain-containing protein [Corallococcus exiguus]TNV45336.1 DUF2238 domain-containing protein [Corallococcus exiguus]